LRQLAQVAWYPASFSHFWESGWQLADSPASALRRI